MQCDDRPERLDTAVFVVLQSDQPFRCDILQLFSRWPAAFPKGCGFGGSLRYTPMRHGAHTRKNSGDP